MRMPNGQEFALRAEKEATVRALVDALRSNASKLISSAGEHEPLEFEISNEEVLLLRTFYQKAGDIMSLVQHFLNDGLESDHMLRYHYRFDVVEPVGIDRYQCHVLVRQSA